MFVCLFSSKRRLTANIVLDMCFRLTSPMLFGKNSGMLKDPGAGSIEPKADNE